MLLEIESLRRRIADLEQEKQDLEALLDMTTEHSDAVEEELHCRAEEALLESERRLRMIVEATPVAVYITGRSDGEIYYANAMAGPMLSVSVEDLIGRKLVDFYVHIEDRLKLLELLDKQGSVDHYEMRIKTQNQAVVWVEASCREVRFNDEPSLLIAMHDITHLKELNMAASRFVPREFLGFLNKHSLVDIRLGDHVTDEMTVMFSDLRSFTSLSEYMSPQENFNFVNAYLGRVSPVIREHSGFIVKYLGDGIMAIFPGSADDGVQAGIETLIQVDEYNAYRKTRFREGIQIGIGINTGYMMVGMVGELHRMQGDAFSDHVNLTARLENLTKHYTVSFIISAATKERLMDPARYDIRFLDKVQIQGRQKALDLYEVYSADPSDLRSLKQETQEEYETALAYYYARNFAEAQSILFRVLQRNPKDKVAWHHLMKTTECLDNGVLENWTGVTVMASK
ncbi:MAG: adenylate/guanylate cyclase domain-containing protein [Gammaproteobacteria bacterium]